MTIVDNQGTIVNSAPRYDISFLLDRPVAYHRVFATIGGSTDAGIFLSQAWYWSLRTTDPDGWFYKTGSDWEEETALTRRQLDTVRKKLKALGFLEDDVRGVPATTYYRLNRAAIYDAIEALSLSKSQMHQNAKLDAPKRQTEFAEAPNQLHQSAKPVAPKRQTLSTETTSESTSKTTSSTKASAPSDAMPAGDDDDFFASLVSELKSKGVTLSEARKLAKAHPDRCRAQIDALPHRKSVKSASAALADSIRNDWPMPPGMPGMPGTEPERRESEPRKPKTIPPEALERIKNAVTAVMAGFDEGYREMVLNDKAADLEGFIRKHHANEFAAEMRRLAGK